MIDFYVNTYEHECIWISYTYAWVCGHESVCHVSVCLLNCLWSDVSFSVSSETSSKCCWGNTGWVMAWVNINHQVNFTWMSLITQQCDTYSCPWLQIFHFRPNTSPTLLHQVMPTFITHQVMPLQFTCPYNFHFHHARVSNHGSFTSPTGSSSPFCTNSSYPTWIGSGSRNHMSSRWPQWLHGRQSSAGSLTAPCPSPTTPTCSHYPPEVEAYHPDDPTGAVFPQSLSPDQHYPDRQLRLPLSPEQIEVLVSLCLPKARARRNGDIDRAPQSRKGWVCCSGSFSAEAHGMTITWPQQVGIRT